VEMNSGRFGLRKDQNERLRFLFQDAAPCLLVLIEPPATSTSLTRPL
jgi:hypothetical protein